MWQIICAKGFHQKSTKAYIQFLDLAYRTITSHFCYLVMTLCVKKLAYQIGTLLHTEVEFGVGNILDLLFVHRNSCHFFI